MWQKRRESYNVEMTDVIWPEYNFTYKFINPSNCLAILNILICFESRCISVHRCHLNLAHRSYTNILMEYNINLPAHLSAESKKKEKKTKITGKVESETKR